MSLGLPIWLVFFFFSSFHLEFFQLRVTSISVTGGLQTGLDSKIPTVHVLWSYIGRANDFCCLERSPRLVYFRLAAQRTLPRRGLHTWRAPSRPSLPPATPVQRRMFCFFFLPWEPRQEPARELKTCRSSCRDSVLYCVLVHLGFVNFPNCRKVLTLKDLYLLCQSKTWRKIHFYSFYLGALSFFFVKAIQ